MEQFLEFEKPIINLENRLRDLQELAKQEGVDFTDEITILQKKVVHLIDETFAKLLPWQRVQLSRHPNRPYTRDYIDLLFPDFMELHGDRTFGEDQALLGGIATWPPIEPGAGSNGAVPFTEEERRKRTPILILGHQKGRTTKQKMERNFGMAKPEGYRKAIRLMQLAERTRMPILTLIDTPGAYPGIEAEARGQSQAIAESIQAMFQLSVPVVAAVVGEGGSGGALAIGIADVVLAMEYAIYSVISPESCASILWNDSSLAERAAERLRMMPNDLMNLGVIDGVIQEPKGGAHRDWVEAARLLRTHLMDAMDPLLTGKQKSNKKVMQNRIDKFRKMGAAAIARAPVESEMPA